MSFAATTDQIMRRQKSVTRRLGWTFLKPGDRVMAVVKGQGLKKGEKVEKLGVIRIVSVRRERLDAITWGDVVREGYAKMSPYDTTLHKGFIRHFCAMNRCDTATTVTRIEFSYDD